jgi:tRNA-dihydrouridine synthase
MVAASDYPFRCLCRQYSNVDLSFTQMLHAKHLVAKPEFLQSNWDVFEVVTSPEEMVWTKAQSNCFGGVTAAERERLLVPPCRNAATGPIVVQLAGHDVETVTKAALLVLEKSDGQVAGVDLNLGCPQNIARKGRYGAFLMEDNPDMVYQILQNLRRTLPSTCTVSAKIRLPLNPTTQDERIQRLRDTGSDFLTVHGRDLKENKTNVRGIHTDRMRQIVDLAYPLPVVANGGIELSSDVARVLEATGAAAIMTSEAMLERPHFLQIKDEASVTPQVRFQTQLEVAQSYLDWCRFSPPFPGVLGTEMGSFCIVRGHLFKMLYPYLQEHRDIRDTLASRSCHTIQQAQLLISDLRSRYDDISDWDRLRSSSTHSSWYRRHRQANVVVRDTSDKKSPALVETKLSIEERKVLIKRRIELRKSGLA